MQTVTPETRACLDFAFRQVVWMDVYDEFYVCRDGITIAFPSSVTRVELSGDGALIHLVAKAMQAHLRGVDLAQARNDLIAANVGKLLADKVHDHLVDVSVGEWQRLRERVAFYAADDNTALLLDHPMIEGVT
jgi:hypothetical protein